MAIELTGRTVIVTGGTKGIGRTIVERYLHAGCNVLTCGRREPESVPSADGRTARFVAADIRELDQIELLVSTAVDTWGRVDVLVNNAGGSPSADAATASPRFSESIIRLNLLAPLHLSQRVNAQMQSQPTGGSIINIASVSAIRPSPGTAAYGAAKAGLLSLTQTLGVEWAPKVRVNAVTCGLIATEAADDHYGSAAGLAAVAATVPLGRMGTPDDVASACLFLASDLSSYMTGSQMLLHGGGERPAFLTAVEALQSAEQLDP